MLHFYYRYSLICDLDLHGGKKYSDCVKSFEPNWWELLLMMMKKKKLQLLDDYCSIWISKIWKNTFLEDFVCKMMPWHIRIAKLALIYCCAAHF
jgi:hypothetical protein